MYLYVQSESSGAVTDSLPASCNSPYLETSSSTSITGGEMPRLFQGGKTNMPGSIVTFAQKKRASQLLTSNETTIPSQQFEVSVYRYNEGQASSKMYLCVNNQTQ